MLLMLNASQTNESLRYFFEIRARCEQFKFLKTMNIDSERSTIKRHITNKNVLLSFFKRRLINHIKSTFILFKFKLFSDED